MSERNALSLLQEAADGLYNPFEPDNQSALWLKISNFLKAREWIDGPPTESKAGMQIECNDGELLLVGDVNELGGVCDCCRQIVILQGDVEFGGRESGVRRWRTVFESGVRG